jgi:UDP-2,3-diacylglucosamine hydrolase
MSAPREAEGPIALICGAGSLPLAVADFLTERGRDVILLPLQGVADENDYRNRPHTPIRVVQLGPLKRALRAANCRDIVLIGAMVRPAFWQMRFDWDSLKLLPRIAAAFRGGDDHLLRGVAKLFEQQGARLLGAHEVAPEILVPQGSLARLPPAEEDREDIAFGLAYLHAAGPFDVGQAVVVAGRHVLAVEAAEGTDGMLARVAKLRANGRIRSKGGVLVKAPKPQQDRRFDLPSIGPATVEGAAKARLSGIAVAAKETIMAEPAALAAAADKAGIFVIGVPVEAVE